MLQIPAALWLKRWRKWEVREGDRWYSLRTALQGVAGKVLGAVGVAVPPSVRPASFVAPRT
ncbi:MAG: hypothetical protein Q8O40_10425 [Chloroflexota bacterium]|nr:hypothetical protein [Chloroflexota bacterium]